MKKINWGYNLEIDLKGLKNRLLNGKFCSLISILSVFSYHVDHVTPRNYTKKIIFCNFQFKFGLNDLFFRGFHLR